MKNTHTDPKPAEISSLLLALPFTVILRTGNGTMASVSLTIISLFVVVIIIDRYPCWTGAPNCD